MTDKEQITGIILAAGFSSRMKAFKALLNYNGKSFLLNIIDKLSAVCNNITVVTGFQQEKIVKHLDEFLSPNLSNTVSVQFNPEFETGMFSSLQTGLRLSPDTEWFIYHFVDQPKIPQAFYREFTVQIDKNHDWIQPSFKNQKGHPLLFNKSVKTSILNTKVDNTLREISRNIDRKKVWDCKYPEVLLDLDTPDELNIKR